MKIFQAMFLCPRKILQVRLLKSRAQILTFLIDMVISGQKRSSPTENTFSPKKKKTRADVNDPQSTSAKGCEGSRGKIIVTFNEGLDIQNNVNATWKLAGASIPPSNEMEIFSTSTSVCAASRLIGA